MHRDHRVFPHFCFNDTATPEIYTLSLHDALPIWRSASSPSPPMTFGMRAVPNSALPGSSRSGEKARKNSMPLLSRSEEHTSELQSRQYLVCRLLLEKKNEYGGRQARPSSAPTDRG